MPFTRPKCFVNSSMSEFIDWRTTLSNFSENAAKYLPQITNRNGKLYTTDNQIFTPRGVNYIRLNGSQGTKANLPVYHSTFSPKYYEGNRSYTENMFQKLHLLKFNIVRVL